MSADTTVINPQTQLARDHAFIAMQFALSSYPEDPVRMRLRKAVEQIQQSSVVDDIVAELRSFMQTLHANRSLIEYCVWDYSLVSSVANSEFASWVSGIREVRQEPEHEKEEVLFQVDCSSYCIATFALRSKHESLANWLRFFPEHLEPTQFFDRKTMGTILERFATTDSTIIANSTEVLCELMPKDDQRFYSAKQLHEDEAWDYLRPMF